MESVSGRHDPVVVGSAPGAALVGVGSAGRLAFWINAYNAMVRRGIRALGLRQSVWEVPDLFDRIAYRLGDLLFTANDIEHGILRDNRANPLTGACPFAAGDPRAVHAIRPPDPRVHFALNCGARSCPPLWWYEPETVEAQLDAATRAFVEREVRLEGGRLVASPIFDWFRADFDAAPGGLRAFLLRYLPQGPEWEAVRREGVAGLAWGPYDWRLGEGGAQDGAA